MPDRDTTVVVVARLTPVPERRDELVAAIAEAIPGVHEESGCLRYALHAEPETGLLMMVESWADRAALDAHLAGAPFKAMGERLAPLCAAPAELHILEPLPAGDPAKGVV